MNNLFNGIVGNVVAVSMLQNIMSAGNIAPAYLFTGISGIGKFKAAMIFAQHLIESQYELLVVQPKGEPVTGNVTPPKPGNPKGVNSIKIEQIREVAAWCATKPVASNRKVVIIDADGELSEKCGNAILKTLEEPPSYVTIIIVSNRKMIPTINSRCHLIDFKQLFNDEVMVVLDILGHSNVHEAIIQASYGSPGRALRILEVWGELSPFVENLSAPPNTTSSALSYSNEISQLDCSSQLLLLQLLGLTWWTNLKDPHLLSRCTTAIQYLDKVSARAVWDDLLIPI